MKKLMIVIAAVLAAATTMLVGCGEATNTTSTSQSASVSVKGTTWEITELSEDGNDAISVMKELGGDEFVATITFTTDGVVKMNLMGDEETLANYTEKDGKLYIDNDEVTLQDNTISFEKDGLKLVMEKQ